MSRPGLHPSRSNIEVAACLVAVGVIVGLLLVTESPPDAVPAEPPISEPFRRHSPQFPPTVELGVQTSLQDATAGVSAWAAANGYEFAFDSCVETTAGELLTAFERWSLDAGAGIATDFFESDRDSVAYLCGVLEPMGSTGVIVVAGDDGNLPMAGLSFWESFDAYPGDFFAGLRTRDTAG